MYCGTSFACTGEDDGSKRRNERRRADGSDDEGGSVFFLGGGGEWSGCLTFKDDQERHKEDTRSATKRMLVIYAPRSFNIQRCIRVSGSH